MGQAKDRSRYGAARQALRKFPGAEAEAAFKAARNFGGANYAPPAPEADRQHQHFGLVIVSCEHADLRPQPDGVMIYGDTEAKLDPLAVRAPRAEVIDELYASIVDGRPPLHSGEWARATVEVLLAMLRSSRDGAEVTLRHQVAPLPVASV
jgi:phthalate 4,5-cis-dihydrodiol dehydrogenase